MRRSQWPQALEKTEALIASKPREAQGRFLKGLILTEMNRPSDAIAIFTRLTEDFPELPEPYNNLAVLYAQQKQYDRARSALEMAIRTHPSYAIAHENLGDIYATLASQAYGKALQIDSSNAATQTKLSMIRDLIGGASKSKPTTLVRADSGAATPPPASGASAPPSPTSGASTPPPAEPTVKTPPTPTPTPPPPPERPVKAPEMPKPPEAPASVEKTPEKTTPAETPAASTASVEQEVAKTLQSWVRAWSRKDVKAYLAHYAKDFQTPKGVSRKAWETERTQRIDRPGRIQVSAENVRISASDRKATVKFRQHYASASFKSSANKTLVFVKSGNRWLIQQEAVN